MKELKARLSAYLAQVKRGETVSVTERGHVVARIIPAAGRQEHFPEALAEKLVAGDISWSGRPFTPSMPTITLHGAGPSMSDLVSQQRS